jgi:hypothetical protein
MASTNNGEYIMFNRIFGKLRQKKNIVRQEIVKDKTETNKYLDPECNLYRHSLFNYYSDKNDELYEFIEGFHTIPVHEGVEFEQAVEKSISFKENRENYKKKLLLHRSLMNPQRGTRGSTCKYMFEDGSLYTTLSHYKDNSR